jgi:propanol-preferring alcohol dehydrogenase
MKALQLVEPQQAPQLREIAVQNPGYGQVLIKVGGAGACHSDLHVMEWPADMMAACRLVPLGVRPRFLTIIG